MLATMPAVFSLPYGQKPLKVFRLRFKEKKKKVELTQICLRLELLIFNFSFENVPPK